MIVEIFIAILIGTCVIGKNNRTMFFVFSSVMFLLMTFATYNADFFAYLGRYARMTSFEQVFGTDIGFGALMFFVKRMGLSFRAFLGVICVIGLLLVRKCYFKYSKVPCIQLVVYFILFYYAHTVQIRAFISEWIVVYAILEFLQEKSNLKKYIVLIFIATTFHYSSLFFLVLIIPRYIDRKWLVYGLTIAFVILFPLIFQLFLRFSPASAQIRMEIYFEGNERRGIATFVFIGLFFALSFFTLLLALITKARNELSWADRFYNIYYFNVVDWIPLGFIIMFSNNFFRLNRPMILVSVLYIIEYYLTERYKGAIEILIISFCLPVLYGVSEVVRNVWYDSIAGNLFFNFIGLV